MARREDIRNIVHLTFLIFGFPLLFAELMEQVGSEPTWKMQGREQIDE